MIRAALITIVFLGITLTLILMQPSPQHMTLIDVPEPPDTPADDNTVSRAEIGFDVVGTVAETPGLDAVTGSLAEPAPKTAAATPQATPDPDGPALRVTPDIAASVATEPSASVASAPDPAPAPETAAATGLERLVINALAQGQSDAYIDALVNDAAAKGKVEVPQSLVTSDGRVDTSSLLAVLSHPPQPDFGPGGSYIVQPGDSLASIAYRFYGNTGKAVDIFIANRSALASPNHIEIGQTLALPEL